jgi:hypothetical protein
MSLHYRSSAEGNFVRDQGEYANARLGMYGFAVPFLDLDRLGCLLCLPCAAINCPCLSASSRELPVSDPQGFASIQIVTVSQ